MRVIKLAITALCASSIHASAQESICLGVNCDDTSDMVQQMNSLFAQQLDLNELLAEQYGAGFITAGQNDHQECISNCRTVANERRDNCNQVYDAMLPGTQEARDLGQCLEAVEEWHYHCLSYDLLNCQN